MFTDSHCHLFNEYYGDINEILDSSKNNNVTKVISDATSLETCKEMLELSKNDMVYITLGIHPEEANNYNKEDLSFIEENLSNPKVIAVGEIGLDYHYDGYDKEKQIELFEMQLRLAEKYNMPVVIHSRDATKDTIDTLKKHSLAGVIHSFSGSVETAKEYIKMGYKLGINGVITFKNAHLKDTIKEIGIDHIILETDSPYLTPHPYRGKRNEPSYVLEIARFISDYLNIPLEKVSEITQSNIKDIFNI